MSLQSIVQNLYNKYKSDVKFNTSLILSEVAAPFGAAAVAYVANTSNLNDYISSVAGGIIGNYVSAVATFGTAWYFFNKESYRNKIKTFAKETGEILLKNLPPAAISFALFSPIAAGFTYYGSEPERASFYASLLSAALFIGGSNLMNQGVIGKYRDKNIGK